MSLILRESVFILALAVTALAVLDCAHGRLVWVGAAVVAVQLATHVRMLVGQGRVRCNPAQGPQWCNAVALAFGAGLSGLFLRALVRGDGSRLLAALGAGVGAYCIASHLVHIPLEAVFCGPVGHALAATLIAALAAVLALHARRGALNAQFHASEALHERGLRRRLDAVLCGLPRGSTAVDAGAWLGDHTVPLARRHPGVHFYAIEPGEENYHFLRSKARALPNVTAAWLALGEADGRGTHLGGSGPAAKYLPSADGAVPMRSIDSLVQSGALRAPALVHLDVEGLELAALRGAARTLAAHRPVLAVETLGCDELPRIEAFLRTVWSTGYHRETVNETCSFGDLGDRRRCRNHLFFPHAASG
jgi:FkbM family methyltransferase